MILVIAGHTIALEYSAPIYTFHMPLFFFLSGLFIKTDVPFGSFFVKKTKSILSIWLIVFVVSLSVCLCIPEWRGQISMKTLIKDLYSSNTNVVQNSSLWFLVCLFFAEIVFWLVEQFKKSSHPYVFYALFLLLSIFVLWQVPILDRISHVIPIIGNRLPFKIDTALCAVVFIAVGSWGKPYINRLLDKCNVLCLIALFALWLALALFNGWTNLNALVFGRYKMLFYPIAFLGIAWTLGLSKLISDSGYKGVSRFLSFYGRNSLIIFAFQSIFIRLYILIINNIMGLKMALYANNPIEHQVASFIIVGFVVSPIIAYTNSRRRKAGI